MKKYVFKFFKVLFAVSVLFTFSKADVSPLKILSEVKKNYSKIKSFSAKIIQKTAEGRIIFEGKIFYKKPKSKIVFTGPKDFPARGLSSIADENGVVTVDENGVVLVRTPSNKMDFLQLINGDISSFGRARIWVEPVDSKKINKATVLKLKIRMPEEKEEVLDAYKMQEEFLSQLVAKKQMKAEDYQMYQKYMKKNRTPSTQSPLAFWKKDADVFVDVKRNLIKKIVFLDGDYAYKTTKFIYKYIGGKYLPVKIISEEDGEKQITVLSNIKFIPISDKIFRYRQIEH